MNLENLKQELQETESFLAKPDAFSSPDFAEKAKRATLLREINELNDTINQNKAKLKEAESLITDPELGEIAREDAETLKASINSDTARLEELLIPRDPSDDKPAIIEIRAGAGGDEASLFASESNQWWHGCGFR